MSEEKKGAVSVHSAALVGIDAQMIEVECDQRPGLIQMSIVGLADKACVEAKERIRSALRNTGLKLPQCHVVFNLAPAELPKYGSGFDLAMAVALLIRRSELPAQVFRRALLLGELALDGKVRGVSGVLSAVEVARDAGLKEVFVPFANAAEATLVDGVRVLPVASLSQVIEHARGQNKIAPASRISAQEARSLDIDFRDIRGQELAKRALEIAAAGNHHLLMSGPPGSGKTMLARSLPSILPPMTVAEMTDVTKVYSAAGALRAGESLVLQRPWRAPHHSASASALVGGGNVPRPGEISLAHRGVLFLDELPEFSRQVLDHLRQPLETGRMSVSRSLQSLEFPARFLLVAAMNPCPCGYANDPERNCGCLPVVLKRYQQRLSGPLLDRFDMKLEVERVAWEELSAGAVCETSEQVRARVVAARERQIQRQGATNQEISTKRLEAVAKPDKEGASLLRQACRQLMLSNRAYFRVLRVARTIADLGGMKKIYTSHIAEALQYRQS